MFSLKNNDLYFKKIFITSFNPKSDYDILLLDASLERANRDFIPHRHIYAKIENAKKTKEDGYFVDFIFETYNKKYDAHYKRDFSIMKNECVFNVFNF